MNTDKILKEALKNYLVIPDKIERLACICTLDLYFGPYSHEHLEPDERTIYTDFSAALKEVQNWLSANVPSDLYIDVDCGHVSDIKPDECYWDDETGETIENDLSSVYQLDGTRQIMKAYGWNKEFCSYL